MSGTVTVACKLPHGLVLSIVDPKVFEGVNPKEGVPALPRDAASQFTVAGCARPVGVPLPEDAAQVVSGYALTPGVPADFWETWLRQNKDAAFVKAGLIFAHTKAGDTIAEAREKKAIKSGLEGLDPEKPAPGIARADRK